MSLKENTKPITYTLLFPFQLKSGESLTDLISDKQIGNLSFSIDRQSQKYILKVQGFKSEEEAKDYVNQIWAVFAWLLVNTDDGLPFNACLDFGHAYYPADPKKAAENLAWSFGGKVEKGEVVNIFADGDFPIVYRTNSKIKRLFSGEISFKRTRNVESLVSVFEQFADTDISNIVKQSKLKIALELYNAYFYEFSDNAKFLILIMVLETLKPKEYKHQIVIKLLDKWKKEVDFEIEKVEKQTLKHYALTDLEKDVMFKREASLRSQVRALVRETFAREGNEKVNESVKIVNKLYDKRSRLVHDGELPPHELRTAIEQARNIVISVLKAKLIEAIK